MTDVAIRVEQLSKKYRIGQRERYYTLRDTLTDALYAPFRGLSRAVKSAFDGGPNSKLSRPDPIADAHGSGRLEYA